MDSSGVAGGRCVPRHLCPSSIGDVTVQKAPIKSSQTLQHKSNDEQTHGGSTDIPIQLCTLKLTPLSHNHSSASLQSSSSFSSPSSPSSPTKPLSSLPLPLPLPLPLTSPSPLTLSTSSPTTTEKGQKPSSILTKMSHLIVRNPISLTVTLCLILLFLFFAFTFGPSTALAAKSHTPAALIGLFDSDFSSSSSSSSLSLESSLSEEDIIDDGSNLDQAEVEDRAKTKDTSDSEDIYIESPPQPNFNDGDDYDRPETVPVMKVNYDEDDEPPSPTHAKLVNVQTSSKNRAEIDAEQARKYLREFLASKAARTRLQNAEQQAQNPQNPPQNHRNHQQNQPNHSPHHYFHSPQSTRHHSTSTENTIMPGNRLEYSNHSMQNGRISLPEARDLTNPSERIAQLFQDLRTANSRMSRDDKSRTDNAFVPISQPCGETLKISTSVEISSPGYPNNYGPNLDCHWNIIAGPEQTLRVQIFKLNIEKDNACRFDHLDIKGILRKNKNTKETIERTKRYCGSNSDQEITIYSNKVTILFHSDSNNEHTGFFLRVIADSKDCLSQVQVLNSTYLTSPKYPNSYGDSVTCWTLVTAQPNHRLFVQFELLRLEWNPMCTLDYIQIYDGESASQNNSLGRWCSQPENATVSLHSTGSSLLFHFNSDDHLALVGYKAKVVSLRKDVDLGSYVNCNWNADWKNMTISSPFYPDRYPLGTECQTSITSSSPEERIVIFFDWIDLNDNVSANSDNSRTNSEVIVEDNKTQSLTQSKNVCASDRLEIWESLNDTVPSNVFCGYRNQPFKYVSKSNSIRLVFKSAATSMDESIVNHNDRHRSETGIPNNNPGFAARFTFTNSKPGIGKSDQNVNNDYGNGIDELNPMPNLQFPGQQDSGYNKPILLRKPENASVIIGTSHILFCDVTNGPNGTKPQIIWFKGDREIHEGVSADRTSLLIQQFLPSSAGRYVCVYGDNSSDAYLTVMDTENQCPGTNVLYRERPKDQYTTEGEFVMLQCSVTESIDPLAGVEVNSRIIWKKMDIHSNGVLKPVEFNSRIKILRGGIIFDPALVEDSGFYFCVVDRNSTNSDSDTEDSLESKNSKDCEIKSAARVQINQRVDVNEYCGRAVIKPKAPEFTGPGSMSDYGKIIGGTEATPGEFPWMVMFWDDKRHVFCGGALLNERWVMTAAHCFTDATDQSTVFVKLGKNDQSNTEPTEIVTKIQDIIRHPSFSKETFDNDIALIKLQKHITFSDYIRPICLPSSSEEAEAMKNYFFNESLDSSEFSDPRRFGYVTGWGRLKESGPLPRFLHKIRLPIVEERRCHEMTSFKVTDNMFCAGYGKEIVGDACKGDSGGPFTVLFENRYTLLGVVSWGEGCGRQEKYGYYTKVNNYISWIRRLTRHTY